MIEPNKYRGTTVTEFSERHFSLLVTLALFLGLTLLAAGHTTTFMGRTLALFSFCVTLLLWLALLYQCARARPLTALMELLAVVLFIGFIAVSVATVLAWWAWRVVVLPVVFYLSLFLILDERGLTRRPAFATRRSLQLGLRLFCLLLAGLLAYLLKFF
ncbi:MAG TPA: hypothetical protein VE821_01020 [Pyrinomonadaceae bacterium]|nr:hypothetical protein [Pyrinomonadaceae bacterium]